MMFYKISYGNICEQLPHTHFHLLSPVKHIFLNLLSLQQTKINHRKFDANFAASFRAKISSAELNLKSFPFPEGLEISKIDKKLYEKYKIPWVLQFRSRKKMIPPAGQLGQYKQTRLKEKKPQMRQFFHGRHFFDNAGAI